MTARMSQRRGSLPSAPAASAAEAALCAATIFSFAWSDGHEVSPRTTDPASGM
jgi:hypothetical protein